MIGINYSEPLFRPPSEARSLIFQPTIGCSWNKCSFCEMYTSKKFSLKNEDELFSEIDSMASVVKNTRKVFLADGNAMVLSYNRLMKILEKLNDSFPSLNRVSAYALPSDLATKTTNELKNLNNAGLKLLYTGIETGDNELLKLINKGESDSSMVKELSKARKAGIKLSLMILNGLGGKEFSIQHITNSANVVSKIKPEFLSTLVLSYPYGIEHFRSRFNHRFTPLSKLELIKELHTFISNLNLDETIYRSDHASNYITLKGILNRDKDSMINKLKEVITNFDENLLKPDWLRGL